MRSWLAAATVVVVVTGIGGLLLMRQGSAPSQDGRAATVDQTVVDSVEDLPATTLLAEPARSVPDASPNEDLAGVRFPVEAAEQDAEWVVPWRDGFLVGAVDLPADGGGAATVRARFTTDGASWESVEMTMPAGLNSPARVTSVDGRLIMAGSLEPTGVADMIRVASTTDLLNWSAQDFEVPDPRPLAEVSELGGSFTSMGSFAVNATGWAFDVLRIYSDDVTLALPDDVKRQTDEGVDYRIRSDDNGFSVAVQRADGSPATLESTYEYSWAEVGISPDAVPLMTGEVPTSRTWAATWGGAPAAAETPVPSGSTLGSSEGFVRWNDHTWFSADGLIWTASPLPDPNGTVQNVLPVEGGFVAIVRGQDGTIDVYRLDERGGNARPIDIDGLPTQFAMSFAGHELSLPQPATSAAVLDAGFLVGATEAPLIIDSGEYRLVIRTPNVSVVDLATGETVLTDTSRNRAPGADTVVEFTDDDLIVTDPANEMVLIQIPITTFLAAQEALQDTTRRADADEYVEDLRVLASSDGERFLVESLRPSNPIIDLETGSDAATDPVVSTNGGVVLVRLDDEWVRFELPS